MGQRQASWDKEENTIVQMGPGVTCKQTPGQCRSERSSDAFKSSDSESGAKVTV